VGIFPWLRQNHVPWGRLSLWKWVPRISPGIKAAGTYGCRPTTLVVLNVEMIWGVNLPGTPRATSACCGMTFTFTYNANITSFFEVETEILCVIFSKSLQKADFRAWMLIKNSYKTLRPFQNYTNLQLWMYKYIIIHLFATNCTWWMLYYILVDILLHVSTKHQPFSRRTKMNAVCWYKR
jgi:hypothetical protein